jgi:hypothetical protein
MIDWFGNLGHIFRFFKDQLKKRNKKYQGYQVENDVKQIKENGKKRRSFVGKSVTIDFFY